MPTNPLSFLPLIAFLINAFVWTQIFALRRKDRIDRSWLALTGMLTLWALVSFITQHSPAAAWKTQLFRLASACWIPLSALFLNFVYAVLGRKTDWRLKYFGALAAAGMLLALGTELLVTGFSKTTWGFCSEDGPLFLPLIAVVVLLPAGTAIRMLVRRRDEIKSDFGKMQFSCILQGSTLGLGVAMFTDVILPELLSVDCVPELASSAGAIVSLYSYLALTRHGYFSASLEDLADVIFANAPDGVVLADTEGFILRLNRAAAGMLGERASAEEERRLSDLLPNYAPGLEFHRLEIKLERDGESIMLSCSQFPLRKDGRVKAVMVLLLRDIGERKLLERNLLEAKESLEKTVRERTAELERSNAELLREIAEHTQTEQALRESRGRLEAIFSTAGDAIFVKDRQGCYLQINQAMCELFGLPEEKLLNHRDREFFDTDGADHLHEVDARVLAGEHVEEETVLPFRGKPRTMHIVKTPVRNPAGEICALCGIARDITERRVMEEHLRQAEKMEAIGLLAGGMAHDFNNQLAIIMGFADLIRELDDDAELSGYAERIVNVAKRTTALNRQLLAFARKGKLQSAPFDLAGIVREVVELLKRTTDRNIEIVSELQDGELRVTGDSGQVQNALLNIGINARDAMPGGGRLKFFAGKEALADGYGDNMVVELPPGEYAMVAVTDTGKGMDRETLARIFEPFFTTKEKGKGTGMGLAAVYGAVQSHGGGIRVESVPGKGTDFRVYLPLSAEGAVEAGSAVTATAEIPVRRGRLHVLLAEDEEDVRLMTANMLRQLGHKVHAVADGKAAVDAYSEGGFDLVVLDVIMPVMNGRDAFALIRKRDPQANVAIISGFSGEMEEQDFLTAGAIGFLSKPFTLAELTAVLSHT